MKDILEFIALWFICTGLCVLFTAVVKKIFNKVQIDLLTQMCLKYPNDADLGSEVRKIVQNHLEK